MGLVKQTCCRHSFKSLSYVWLFWDPMDCRLPGSSVHGILQAAELELVAVSFSRGSCPPRDQTWIICIGKQVSSPLSYQGSPEFLDSSQVYFYLVVCEEELRFQIPLFLSAEMIMKINVGYSGHPIKWKKKKKNVAQLSLVVSLLCGFVKTQITQLTKLKKQELFIDGMNSSLIHKSLKYLYLYIHPKDKWLEIPQCFPSLVLTPGCGLYIITFQASCEMMFMDGVYL